MLIPSYTKERLLQTQTKAEASFRYFAHLMGVKDLDDGIHLELCLKLQDPGWRRFLLSMFRGSYKTSITKTYIIWYLLTHIDHNALLVEQREKNAAAHNEEMQMMMKSNALFLEIWKQRLPAGYIGWNAEGWTFVRTSAVAHRSFRIAGLESRLESIHADIIWCNDLEGADAEIGEVPNESSERFIEDRSIPLLRDRKKSKILVEGTPHGNYPLVHKLKERWADRPEHVIFWVPIADENRKPTIPSIADQSVIDEIETNARRSHYARRMADQQFYLLPGSRGGGGFNMDVIEKFMYERPNAYVLRYPELDLGKSLDPNTGLQMVISQSRNVEMRSMRYYMHGDPAHKGEGEHRPGVQPSEAAIIVVGVTHDFHVFVVDTWIKQAAFNEYLLAYVRLYCKWRAYHAPTHEAIGAQAWFRPALKLMEETMFRRYIGDPQPWDPSRPWLPRLSERLVDAAKGNIAKETQIIQSLELWFNMGWLHLHKDQIGLLTHLRRFPSPDVPYDGADALAQGPKVWSPPLSPEYHAAMKKRRALLERLQLHEPLTGYRRPWVEQNLPPVPSPFTSELPPIR